MIPIHRGDIVLVNLPFIQDLSKSKARPALVVQNDIGNRFSSNTIVLSITSMVPSKTYPTHYKIKAESRIGKNAGITKDSIVQAETILTIPQSLIAKKLGSLPQTAMDEIEKRIKISLALK
ncbi:MAG: type II toxin-antitoxin system PemK/MazF family toxin [bacterium]